jgi:hypothetical protein
MDLLVQRCAGLDVHHDTVVTTVRVPSQGPGRRRRAQHTLTFATTTAGIRGPAAVTRAVLSLHDTYSNRRSAHFYRRSG